MSHWPTQLEVLGLFLSTVAKQAELEVRCWMPQESPGSPRESQALVCASTRRDTLMKGRRKLRWPQHNNGTCKLQNTCLAIGSNLSEGNLSRKLCSSLNQGLTATANSPGQEQNCHLLKYLGPGAFLEGTFYSNTNYWVYALGTG